MDEDITKDEKEKIEEYIEELRENTEKLDIDTPLLREKVPFPKEELHISDFDDVFSGIVKKRDYHGKVEIHDYNDDKPTKKRKLKKWVYLLLIVPILLIIGLVLIINKHNEQKRLEEEKALIEKITAAYSEYATISKDTKLYEKTGSEYKEIGTIYKDANIKLVKEDIDANTKYFHIKDIDYYVSYEDISKREEKEDDTRYKNYLPFNSNIVTKDTFTMYVDDNKLITLNKEMEFPILINNFEDKYYVEYNNMLVSISKDDVSKTKENKNTDKKNQSKMTTLAYHQIYKPENKCTDPYICMKIDNFDKQMKYLSDNNYFTLTLQEFYMYLKGNLQIEKGVVITFDDGLLFRNADEVLAKYNLKGTGFVTTSLDVNTKGYKALLAQSHTHDLHRNYVCSGGNQGGAILCASKDRIVADLKKSIEILGTEPIGLAYPFYDYNANAIEAVKEAGFKMAFVGRAGAMGKATPKVTDLYKIPRMTVYEETHMSFSAWKSYL